MRDSPILQHAHTWTEAESETANADSLVSDLSETVMQIISPGQAAEREKALSVLRALPGQIERVRAQTNYRYHDYHARLCTPEPVLRNVFETRIVSNPDIAKILSPIKLLFSEPALRGRPELWNAFISKLRVLFEDLIYESLTPEDFRKWQRRTSTPSQIRLYDDYEAALQKFHSDIHRFWADKVGQLNLSHSDFCMRIRKKDFFDSIQAAGEAGFRHVNLCDVDTHHYQASDFVALVQRAGKSGIRSMKISNFELGGVFVEEGLTWIIREAGKSGIKSLDLSCALPYLSPHEEIMTYIKEAWGSGIRSLNLSSNFLGRQLDVDDMLMFFVETVKSGLKVLDISNNQFCSIGEKKLFELAVAHPSVRFIIR